MRPTEVEASVEMGGWRPAPNRQLELFSLSIIPAIPAKPWVMPPQRERPDAGTRTYDLGLIPKKPTIATD